ncbi:MAG: alginate export family protein [Erythrobacter sp.]
MPLARKFTRCALAPLAAGLALLAPAAASAQLVRPAPGQTPLYATAIPEGNRVGRVGDVSINAVVRSRVDAIDGQYRRTGPEDDAMFTLRTQIFGEWDTGPVRLGYELVDARAYARAPNSTVDTGAINALEMVQLHLTAELGDMLGQGSDTELTIGRMSMDVGSRRLLGRPQFRNTANGLTGVRLDRRNAAGDQFLLLWAMPQIRLPREPDRVRRNLVEWDRETTDQQIMVASQSWALPHNGVVQVYAFGFLEKDAEGFATTDRQLFTPGVRWFQPPRAGHFDHEVEAVLQMGRVSTSTAATARRTAQRGYFVHATAGYTIPGAVNLRIAAAFDAASGDRFDPSGADTGERNTRFDPLIGARRWEWGPSSLYGPLNRTNIISPAVRIEANTGRWFDAFVAWRSLWLNSSQDQFAVTGLRSPDGRLGRHAGNQFEARVRYWPIKGRVRFDAGAVLLDKGRFLRDAPGVIAQADTHYGYFDTSVFF